MADNYLLEDTLAEFSLGYVAAGDGDTQDGVVHDMAGFDGALIVASLGTITSTGVATLSVNVSPNSDGSSGTVSSTTVSTSTGASLIILDIRNPQARYIQPELGRATANVVINSIMVIKYRNKSGPVTPAAVASAKILGI